MIREKELSLNCLNMILSYSQSIIRFLDKAMTNIHTGAWILGKYRLLMAGMRNTVTLSLPLMACDTALSESCLIAKCLHGKNV